MKSVYQFKKVVTYEVEANSYDEAVYLRDDFDDHMEYAVEDNMIDEESVESGKWVFTNSVPVSDIEDVILKVCASNRLVDEDGDVYALTEKGRAYVDALNGKGNYDENDFDENGNYIDDDYDIEDEFYDHIVFDN